MALIDLVFEKERVNPTLLHQELAAVLGEKMVGVSTDVGQVRVHLMDDTPKVVQDQVGPIVATNDATKLTTAQQTEVDRATALDALRKPWDEWTALDQTNFLRILAGQAGLIP